VVAARVFPVWRRSWKCRCSTPTAARARRQARAKTRRFFALQCLAPPSLSALVASEVVRTERPVERMPPGHHEIGTWLER